MSLVQSCFGYPLRNIYVFYQAREAAPTVPVIPANADDASIWESLGNKFEGDMILDKDQLRFAMGIETRNGLRQSRYKWPKKVLPYEIVDNYFSEEQEEYIHSALREFADISCVTVRPRMKGDRHYVRVTGRRNGCYAMVGFQRGGAQTLNLAPHALGVGCFRRATIQHEFLHALGFYHMQSAHDRDKYVTIKWDNIIPGLEHNFNRYNSRIVTSHGVKYDYESVMHYGPYAFSRNGKMTIVPKVPLARIGQRNSLSDADIEKLNIMYSCGKDAYLK
ncbi:zinc metalloproteinase nas-13-like [Ctenocephalides felis]|uniref:zinc metalloproteinase nas-13-like n=1 Tax=Ctenocephalides felis TaxID=7515 RepID=UPI000E6E1854|nr:zinc metalloproteinase nas-13-like [Ctenocephalides felis]